MTRRRRRLVLAVTCVALAGIAATLVLWALRSSATYFYSPSDLAALPNKPIGLIRVGGLVLRGTLMNDGPHAIDFKVTDLKSNLEVRFDGVLPSLFREGQGVVAEGKLGSDGTFVADRILAKHDATYMPPEVERALKRRGLWRGDATSSQGAEKAHAITAGSG
jgi:cytochrome c-type biogenesis protein CcmE